MAIDLTSFVEQADSVSASQARFSLQGASAVAPLYLLGENYPPLNEVPTSDVIEAVSTILGGLSNTNAGDGRLSRTLPAAHPLFPWLYAVNIQSIRGLGQAHDEPGEPLLEAPPLEAFSAYPNYEFVVEFGPRPYVVAQDSSVPLVDISFYETDSTRPKYEGKAAGEWVRYTDWWYERKFESITARQGFMKFRSAIATGPPNVQDIPYADMPRLFLPDSLLKIVWYQVPYRFITSPNSYIDGLIGFINQNQFTTWEPGELLYIGYTARRYTPPVQEQDQFYTGTTGFIYSAEKWCDVELLFLRTKRALNTSGEELGDTGNPNWIQAGWNLLPWHSDRNFHYATSEDPANPADNTKWRPLFQSTEFALLFTDPDGNNVFQLPP